MRIKSIFLLGSSFLLVSGCASIVSNSNWPVAIKSTPDTSEFIIKNKKGESIHRGKTPEIVNLASGAGYFNGEKYAIELKKDGYQDKITTLDSELNGWYFGNLVFGGLLGFLVIDPATGAMFRLPESVTVELTPKIKAP